MHAQFQEPGYSPSLSARKRLSTVVEPLLELISRWTGFPCVSLIGGAPPDVPGGDYKMSSVHHGRSLGPVPLKFSEFEADNYREKVLEQFCRFMRTTTSE